MWLDVLLTIAGSIHFREALHLTVMEVELAATKFCCTNIELKVKDMSVHCIMNTIIVLLSL